MTPKITKNDRFWAPKLAPKTSQIGGPELRQNLDAVVWKPLGSKKAPRWLKMTPKSSQDSPKMGQIGLRWGKMVLRLAQDGHKMAQDGLKTAPRWPKMASSSPRWPQTGPKGFQDRPKMGDMGQDGSKMGPTRLQNCFPLLFLLLFLSFSFLCFPFLSFLFLSFPTKWGGSPKLYKNLRNIVSRKRSGRG